MVMAAVLLPIATASASTESQAGAVYVQTNDAKVNAVVAFARGSNGALTMQGTFETGGRGAGAPLGSQGAVILSEDDAYLFAVNAGSNSIASFEVQPDRLSLVGAFPSGGIRPISLTMHGDVLYVLNAGGLANITGFRLGSDGSLARIAGSKQGLSNPMPNAAQVGFSPDGSVLLVTEKSTQLIGAFAVDGGGVASPGVFQSSVGIEPFGFAFDPSGHALVSEAFNGGPGRSAVTSYSVQGTSLRAISPSVGTTQTAACWVAVTSDGHLAFVSNTGSGTISSFGVAGDGSLTLLYPVAGLDGAHAAPIDIDLTTGDGYLYALNSGFGTISKFQVNGSGDLTNTKMFGALPPSAVGMAAR
jgi:6-phosphogluconolactonase (cycloisomerase 2 family)